MKSLTPFLFSVVLFLSVIQQASAVYDPTIGRWLSRDPLGDGPSMQILASMPGVKLNRKAKSMLASQAPAEILQGPNLYGYVFNNPINLYDPLGLWTLGVGVQGSGGFGGGGGLSGGVFIGYSKQCGFSWGLLGTASGGGYAGASASAGGFVQATNANSVSDLKGPGVASGGSGGEGLSVGGEFIGGGKRSTSSCPSYMGGQINAGGGGGSPEEFHGFDTTTGGWTW